MNELARACEELVGFATRLRAAGLTVSYPQVELAAEGLLSGAGEGGEFSYWALRAALTSSPQEGEVFDRVWAGIPLQVPDVAAGSDAGQRTAEAGNETAKGTAASTIVGERQEVDSEGDGDGDSQGVRYSIRERLMSLDFNLYGPAEEALAKTVIRRLAGRLPEQVSRRRRQSRAASNLDFRRTLLRSVRTGGDPVDLAWSGRSTKPRRVVILVDVSGSMQAYAAPMLVLSHAFRKLSPAVDVFTFGTRLTHLSRDALAANSQASWSATVGREVPDWAGGTRIGASLMAYNRGWGRRGMSRGAVIIIFSDGWERDGADEIGRAMMEINRFAYRTMWLNPLAARPGYEPLAGGMSAALPFVDAFLPAASISDLESFTEQLANVRFLRPGLKAARARSGLMPGQSRRR